MSCLNLNQVTLAGRITSDPELKTTPSGISVTTFSIAINRPKSKEAADRKTDFIPIVAWRKTAEFIAGHFRRGSAICISGNIQSRIWKDKNDQNRTSVEVVANTAMFVDGKHESDSSSDFSQADVDAQYADASVPQFEEMQNADSDLPF